jgi:SOS response regulatory protein OraA/RecX
MPTTRPTATEFAIALCAARSLPEKALRERVAKRYPEDETEEAIARLRELRYVDDAAWAERYARDRFERLGKGRHRIRNELLTKGIAPATADASIAAALGEDAERQKAAAVLDAMREKLGRSPATRDDDDSAEPDSSARTAATRARRVPNEAERLKNTLFRRMLARGYPASLVRDLLDVS